MELHQIKYFLALAEKLNFTRAAEACHVSQPALTRAIKALEVELGGELIRRERRTSHLTDLGKHMLPLLQRCYDSATSAKKLARAVTTAEVTPVRAIMSHSVPVEVLLGPLGALFRSFPSAKLQLAHGGPQDVLAALKDGEAEIAVAGPLRAGWDRLEAWPLFEEGFCVALPLEHPLAEAEDVDPALLAGTAFIGQAPSELSEDLRQWLVDQGSQAVIHEVESHRDVSALVAAGLGAAITPESAPLGPGLARAPMTGLTLRRTVSVYGVSGRERSAAASALLSLLRAGDLAPTAA